MPEMREERRVVTALFADVVGSTALAEQHDPEEARMIVGEAIARAVRIVEAYGGTVKDLAGDGMLALFGAPLAHEDDPERALRAALDIATTVTEYGDEVRRGWGVEGFGIRLGVETGEVVVGEVGAGSRVEYGATGDAVNVAARLQGAARPGTVLAGPNTRRLTADRFTWEAVQELALKGKSEPVAAAAVTSVRADASSARPTLAPLTGRSRELGELLGTVEALQAGRGGIVFLSGEPGIGKSRLTLETRDSTKEAVWLEGRAVSYGTSLAWWPVRDLLRTWIGVGTQEPELRVRLSLKRKLKELMPDRAQELQPYVAGVLGLAPEPNAATAALSPEALQFQTYEVLTELVGALAAREPLVLAIDDLHWADATTLGLLERLLPLTEALPLLLFFNHRPETGHGSWALREKAARDFRHLVTTVDLQPLDREAERALLQSLAEGALTGEVEQRVIEYADGNPLYLEELARAVGEGGAAPAGDGVLPATLEGVILARLDRLETSWREVITAAAACGRTFSFALLQAVSAADEGDLRTALHNLLRLDLLQEERRWPDPSYRFKHALIQEAAYRTLVKERRRYLHARAAAWLTDRYSDGQERVFGLLAHHWMQAEDQVEAARYLRLAGEHALREWALDEAVTHLQNLVRVLRQAGREREAAAPLFQLASTLHLAMRFAEANSAWQEAFDLWEPAPPASDGSGGFVMGVNRVPWEVDPFRGYYAANLRLALQLDDSLYLLRPGPSIEPGIAERLEVDDSGLAYRIHLRPGLTFNSGKRLDASTVAAGFRHFLRYSGDATVLWAIRGSQEFSETGQSAELGIATAGERVVEIKLHRHDPAFPIHLVVPQMGCALPGQTTGPYRVKALEDDRAVIERDPAYPRRTLGNIERAEWRPGDIEEVAAWMREGSVDAVVSYGNYDREPDDGQTEQVGPPVFLLAMWPTWHGPPVDEPLRRALASAVDRSRLHRVLKRHQLVATGGIVPPGLPGHTASVAPPFDPDQARQLLAMSGHRGVLRVAYFTEAVYETIQETVKCWEDVLDLPVERIPISIRDNARASAEVHVVQMNWVAHVPDPGYFLTELLLSSSRSNFVGVSDPALDRLLESAQSATVGSLRMAAYHQADRYAVAEKALVIPVHYGSMFAVLQPWIRGWWEWGNPNQRFSELSVLPSSPRYSST